MPLIQWDNTYESGLQEIDDHHQKLLEILNRAYDAKLYSTDKEEIQTIFQELINYSNYHFDTEEQILKDAGLPGLNAHIRKHNYFKNQLDAMMQEFISGGPQVNTDIVLFLWEWLKNHILEDDMQLFSKLSKSK